MSFTWAQRNPEKAREWARNRYRAKRDLTSRVCPQCGKAIPEEAHARRRFCTRECMLAAQLARSKARIREARAGRLCVRCGDEIPASRTAKATCCSERCRDALNERRLMHIKCRALTNYAVKTGRLLRQPCEICGTEDVEAHHVDYFDPLNVRWLCFVHHRNLMHDTSIEEGASSHGSAR
jgi:endogenous inhibitor of DNA gyrase (YacG/DUF329 family)